MKSPREILSNKIPLDDIGGVAMYNRYKKQEMLEFRKRLGDILKERGVSAKDINLNSNYKEFVKKYVDGEVINKEPTLNMVGISRVLGHINIRSSNTEVMVDQQDPDIYPVIMEYISHSLLKVIYFIKVNDGKNIDAETLSIESFEPTRIYYNDGYPSQMLIKDEN